MRQAQKKKEKDKVAATLILAFCVIALTSVFTIKANIDKINGSNTGLPASERAATTDSDLKNKKSNADTSKSTNNVSVNVPVVDSNRNSAENKAEKRTEPSFSFANPVNSDEAVVSNEYAMDHLVYSVTLDQYMTHCGIDIEAPEDSQVTAVASGTVTAVYTDDRYGRSIEITHSDDSGLVSIYSCLSTTEMVEAGDMVSAGQIIGGVGSTALFESLEPSHLHFELLKDGIYVDPGEYIAF